MAGDETDLIFITGSPEYALAGYRAHPVCSARERCGTCELRRTKDSMEICTLCKKER